MRYWSWCTVMGMGLGLSLTLGGCSSDDSETTSVSGGVSLEQLPTEYAKAYCAWLYRCCPSEQLTHLAGAPLAVTGNSEQECRTNSAAFFTLIIPQITASEGKGRMRYEPEGAKACFDALKSSCAAPDTLCNAMVEPLVATGGACSQDGECVGRTCLGETSDADGTCGSPRAMGDACTEGSECQSDSCVLGVCGEKTALGGSCFADDPCASGYCDFVNDKCAEIPYSGACTM